MKSIPAKMSSDKFRVFVGLGHATLLHHVLLIHDVRVAV
eukprot:CAMPEP_0115268670 /NCGR_PEP_ID=MMETSP0270-20121206/52638_1 /TAXON_ID=71861 /ORGANISM="Scrippsiella trochoidea, Strain CCMP3099" /LENGTH=38 /DNA_ID= /DNA_START= /DNA_END= /DNA_ORIENTATION=